MLGRFAGRKLAVDEAVHASESATGDRNRAIGWMLRNYGIVKDDVNAVLEAYFRQCAVLVTARDLAVMAATLANNGVNPVTGERVVSPLAVARTLSVMTSSGMYDYAGEWVYRVGMPAKSGVGGGIIAALPSQIGLGTYSPLLDEHGNSVRGLRLCEDLSSYFDLHVLNRANDVRTCIVADYDVGRLKRRGRQSHEQRLLDGNETAIRILELTGTLTFANIDYVARRILSHGAPLFLVLDLRRVPLISNAAAKMLAHAARRTWPPPAPARCWPASSATAAISVSCRTGSTDPKSAARFHPARRGDRMGGGPDHLPLWRLQPDQRRRSVRSGIAAGAVGGRPRRSRKPVREPPLSSRRAHHRAQPTMPIRCSSSSAAWSA